MIATNNEAAIDPAGAMTDGPDIEPGYRSHGIARADHDEITTLEDFAGKRVCFVDLGSTSGFSNGLALHNLSQFTGPCPSEAVRRL